MKFIVIEGLDGSGKSTQIELVENYLAEKNIKSRFLHFPRPEAPFYGEMIARFLRGELGPIDKVDPYLVALLYAGDRNDAAGMINEWLSQGYAVIADRYLYSNIAFQCAKIKNIKEKDKLAHWIKDLEYNYNKIPVPDLNLFLKVPFKFTHSSLAKRRTGTDREYLLGSDDIHESDLDFQQEVRNTYLWQVEENKDFEVIDCEGQDESMLKPDEIFNKIKTRLNGILNIF
ncbi:MAG: dTMP kinase [Bacteroidales bacterium]|nr:dTMP kinase [Bacteroidales bacterium]MBN2818310.1 dTMP kinase [Bacteroidales bacterium]